MKKWLSALLALMLICSVLLTAIAEEDTEAEDTPLVSAEELSAEISSEDEEEAFRTWAGACVAVISHASSAAYDCIVGAYNYGNKDMVRQLMAAEDIWAVDGSLVRNSKDHSYTDLNNAVIGYRNTISDLALLNELIALKPSTPDKYAHIEAKINTAHDKLKECADTYTAWTDPSDSRSAMDIWGIAEPLYLDDSINTLKGLFYIDSRLSE